MSKVQSGLLLIGVGVGLNVIGRVLIRLVPERQSVGVAGMLLVVMIVSVAIGLLGIVRLVTGLTTKS